MKMDFAERLAATAVDGISVETAHAVIQDFLAHLVRCPLCENTGQFTFVRDAVVDLTNHPRNTTDETRVRAGTTADCLVCGTGAGDPAWVKWFCANDVTAVHCQYAQGSPDGPGIHAACGWRIVLPLTPSAEVLPVTPP